MSDDDSTIEYHEIQGFPEYRVGSDGSFWTRWRKGKRGTGNGRGAASFVGDAFVRLPDGKFTIDGYRLVTLRSASGKIRHANLHRIILEAFHGPAPQGKACCCHNNGNPNDNRAVNLRWGSAKDNAEDARKHGTLATGERAASSKLTTQDVVEIRGLLLRGIKQAKIAKAFGVTTAAISLICRGRNWPSVQWELLASSPRIRRIITYKGRSQGVRDWERELGFNRGRISGRLFQGWSVAEALTTPVDSSKRNRKIHAGC